MENTSKRRGRKKKGSCSLKGHKYWQKRLKYEDSEDTCSPELRKDYTRLTNDLYSIADTEDVVKPSCLRPTGSKKTLAEQYLQSPNEEIIGNRLVSMSKMAELINILYTNHSKLYPECPGDFYFPGNEEITQGICTTINLKCKLCDYKSSKVKMFEEIERSEGRSLGGRLAAKPNVQLTHFLSKCPISQSDIILLFASIECVAFSAKGLQKSINNCSSTWTLVNKLQIEENRDILKDLVARRTNKPEAEITEVSAQIDTSYSSPPKGRAMSQPANQCLTPMLENHTKKKMLIGLTCISKLCPLGNQCNRQHEGCGLNWEPSKPISNSETEAGRQMYLENLKSGIKIKEIVHDGVMPNSHARGMADAARQCHQEVPESQLCTIHLSRGLKRKAFSVKLSTELTGKDPKIKSEFIRKLALAIDKRCTCELVEAKKKFARNPEKFALFMESARLNILQCYTGNHTNCKVCSLACKHYSNPQMLPTYLPHSQYLVLNDADYNELQKIVDYKISPERVKSQRNLRHTNKVEAFHLRCLKATPKSKTCKRHYTARNNSAAHNASIGIGNSIIKFNEHTGSHLKSGGKAITTLNRITKRIIYFAQRQQTMKFKRSRKQHRERKLKAQRISRLSTSDGPLPCSSILSEHAYIAE